MITLGLGLLAVGALLWAARAFSRAKVANIKALLAWLAALAGISLAAMLFLTGRGASAIGGLVLIAPLVWSWWQESRLPVAPGAAPGGKMSRREAYQVLGLPEGASDSDIRAAWVHLMRTAHPDGGGTDWLAARINQAKETLLGR